LYCYTATEGAVVFDPHNVPGLVLDVNPDVGLTFGNVAHFNAPDPSHPKYLTTGGPPSGWGGATRFTIFGTTLTDPGVGSLYALCALQDPAGAQMGFVIYRDGGTNCLAAHIARGLTDLGGAQALGSQLFYGNREQPGTQWSGQDYIPWALVFNGAGATNADKLKLYVRGVRDPSVTYTNNMPTALTNPGGTSEFTAGYARYDGFANLYGQGMLNLAVLANYAASDAEVLAMANLSPGSGYALPVAWGNLPAGSPAVGNFTDFWALSESNPTGAAAVNRVNAVRSLPLLDGHGSGGNVQSRAVMWVADQSGHHNDGTSCTRIRGKDGVCPQLLAGDTNGHAALHFSPDVNTPAPIRFGQFGLVNNPGSHTIVDVINYDFADVAHEMNAHGNELNGPTVTAQATPNAWGFLDNDDFGAIVGHPGSIATIVGDGTNLNGGVSGLNVAPVGHYATFISRYTPPPPLYQYPWLYKDNILIPETEIAPTHLFDPSYNPIVGQGGLMGEWSLGGVGNTDQTGACPMVKVLRHLVFTVAVSNDDLFRTFVYCSLLYLTPMPSLAAPAGLTASGATNAVNLAWTAPTGANAFQVYRGPSPGSETPLAVTLNPSYSDTTAAAGTTYYYKVAALVQTVAGNVTGPQGPEVSAAAQYPPAPPPPPALIAPPALLPPPAYPATWTYPQDQRDDLGAYALLCGEFWTELFGGAANVVDLLRAWRSAERQLVLQLQELQDTVGRLTCPVHHVRNWYEVTLLQSQEGPANPLTYGAGVNYGDGYPYGGGLDQSVAYPLPAEVLGCLFAANDMAAPSATWHAGASLVIDPVGHTIAFDKSPFTDPAVLPEPVLDATGTVVDQQVTVWLFKAELDWQYLYAQFGQPVGAGNGLPSSPALKELINALWDALTVGPTYAATARAVEAMTGVPSAAVEGEVVQELFSDAAYAWAITDQSAYRYAPGVTFLVVAGQRLHEGDALVDAVQIVEPTAGGVPPALAQLALGPGFLLADIQGELVFRNASLPLQVQTGVNGFTKLSWPLGGFPADVTTFFNDLHARGVAAGATLANYLDLRLPGTPGQPGPGDLPTTINPLRFLFQNVLRANCLIVYMRVSQFGDQALGTGQSWALRVMLPPHVAVITYADLTQAPEAVTMSGPGSASGPGYQESYATYTFPG
jgi:hypothetical protein